MSSLYTDRDLDPYSATTVVSFSESARPELVTQSVEGSYPLSDVSPHDTFSICDFPAAMTDVRSPLSSMRGHLRISTAYMTRTLAAFHPTALLQQIFTVSNQPGSSRKSASRFLLDTRMWV